VFESQVRVVERAKERSTSRGYSSEQIYSKGMYLSLQSTRILVGFGRVLAARSATALHAVATLDGHAGVARRQTVVVRCA